MIQNKKIKYAILNGVDGRPSMKNVYSKMNVGNLVVRRRLRKLYYRVYSNNRVDVLEKCSGIDFSECKVLIRWGSQEVVDVPNTCIIYNTGTALKNISNKFESRKIMNAAGVNVPLNVTPQTEERDMNYPIIARPFRHSKGKNFILLNNRNEFVSHYQRNSGGWYYSNFVNKVKEFRVHCMLGRLCQEIR